MELRNTLVHLHLLDPCATMRMSNLQGKSAAALPACHYAHVPVQAPAGVLKGTTRYLLLTRAGERTAEKRLANTMRSGSDK